MIYRNLILLQKKENFVISDYCKKNIKSKIISINQVTEGQEITCSLGLNDVDENSSLLTSLILDEAEPDWYKGISITAKAERTSLLLSVLK